MITHKNISDVYSSCFFALVIFLRDFRTECFMNDAHIIAWKPPLRRIRHKNSFRLRKHVCFRVWSNQTVDWGKDHIFSSHIFCYYSNISKDGIWRDLNFFTDCVWLLRPWTSPRTHFILMFKRISRCIWYENIYYDRERTKFLICIFTFNYRYQFRFSPARSQSQEIWTESISLPSYIIHDKWNTYTCWISMEK